MGNAEVAQLKQKESQRRLSREELLKPKFVEEELYIEELGGTVLLRSMSQEARRIVNEKPKILDEEGNETGKVDQPLFERLAIRHSVIEPALTDSDIDQFKEIDALIIDKLILAIQLLNSVGNLDSLKNSSSGTQSLDLPSVSPNV